MKKKNDLVTILVPILNEKKNIIKLFNNLKVIIKNKPYKVFLIDGGSNDGTFEILIDLIKDEKKYL